MLRIGYLAIFLLLGFSGYVNAQLTSNSSISKNSLADMSLEDLLNLEVNIGTYTPSSLQQSPVSVTIINKEDIYMTPARNVMDLIEVYVPGAFVSNHWLGPRLGIRGVMGDQNTSYLLLLNGENINMKTMNGPFFEIQNRDLNDIESIEIIRGPGSVTYGAGAIGGIINIKTISDAKDDMTTGIEVNTNYRYANIFLRGGLSKNNWTFNYYTSFSKSQGINNPEFFYIDRAHGYGYGFMGYQWGNKGLGTPAPNFYADFWNIPQIKAQLSLKYKTNFHVWARYSDITVLKQQQQNLVQNEPENQGMIGKQFISVAEYLPQLNKHFNLEAKLGYLSQSNRDVSYYNSKDASRDDITQLRYSYAQNEVFLNSLINFKHKELLNIAIGGEFRYLYLGPEWGKEEADFINSFPTPLNFAVYDSINSGFYQHYGSDFATQIDETIDGYQYSVFAEANISPAKYLSFLLSARLDKHEYTNSAISPRLAIISPIHEKHTLKFVLQQAVRLPTFNELYAFNYSGNKDIDPEVKKGVELLYQYLPMENLFLNVSGFYNTLDQIVWTNDGYPDVLGTFDLMGTDIELSYQDEKTKGAISYSFVSQTKWDPKEPIDAYLSNIGTDSANISLPNYALNRLNNIPKHSIKMHLNHNINTSIRLHLDARLAWGYGQKDMLESFKSVHDNYGTEETKDQMDQIYETLINYGYTKPSFTSNLSIVFKPSILPSSEIQIYALNILQINHSRYVFQYWEAGNNRQYPRQVGFVEEPTSIGIKWIWNIASNEK